MAYTSESIAVLQGLEPVRCRPGMYTDTSSPNHLAHEVIDNSVDEALAGHASLIEVCLHDDGSVSVYDNGRGMPTDIHPEQKLPGVELILTRLHAGAKFSNDSYQFSGGLHGVGISVVNALSTRCEVTVYQGKQCAQLACANGEVVEPLTWIQSNKAERKRGTFVRFWPDAQFFDQAAIQVNALIPMLRAKAVLCPGLQVTCTDEIRQQQHAWHYEGGLQRYLMEAVQAESCLPEQGFVQSFSSDQEAAEWALCWTPERSSQVMESYVNLIPTKQGGTHVNGLRTGLLEALREFCERHKLLAKGVKLTGEDVWSHCNVVLSVKLSDPQFAGQTKDRLSSRKAAAFVSGVCQDAMSLWLNTHVDEGRLLASHVLANAEKRLRSEKQVVRKKVVTGPALPGKLSDCLTGEVRRGELFLVEGDSAGGSAKQARDKQFQAIMPLRGKILNTWEVSHSQVMASSEVHDIAVAIGMDPGSDDLSGLRYGKVCILADADSDGAHIATLLCALFVKHFYALVKAGHLYVAMPPLYRIDVGRQVFYALDEDEKVGVLARIQAESIKGQVNIQRFKGLGEMNPMQLRETTMHPDTRRLVQLQVDQEDGLSEVMDRLLAKKRAADRKLWLQEEGDRAEQR